MCDGDVFLLTLMVLTQTSHDALRPVSTRTSHDALGLEMLTGKLVVLLFSDMSGRDPETNSSRLDVLFLIDINHKPADQM